MEEVYDPSPLLPPLKLTYLSFSPSSLLLLQELTFLSLITLMKLPNSLLLSPLEEKREEREYRKRRREREKGGLRSLFMSVIWKLMAKKWQRV